MPVSHPSSGRSPRRARDVAPGALVVALLGCGALALTRFGAAEPPGAETGDLAREPRRAVLQGAAPSPGVSRGRSAEAADGLEPGVLGTVDDSLPFEPTGERLMSIAWRTWVYTDTGPKRSRYGYLRAGARVDARGPAIVNAGCPGGWYRINPRGFVCVGLGSTTDAAHPTAAQMTTPPTRRESLPYLYGLSEQPAPHRYFRLPTQQQMSEVEGPEVHARAARWQTLAEQNGTRELIGAPRQPPAFLKDGGAVHKPYGVEQPVRYQVHAGQVTRGTGFAFLETFHWEGREFGLTSELDIIALDRTRLVRPSEFGGVVLEEDESLPVAFTERAHTTVWEVVEGGGLRAHGSVGRRHAFKLTGQELTGNMLETTEGTYVPRSALRIIEPRSDLPSFATGDRKWVDISINQQALIAYLGRKPVFVTLVSTGRGGLGDPDTEMATVRGTFMIHHKDVSSTMDGDDDRADAFNLVDVPFVQYFHRGFALHGTYWHDDFGRLRSHGCVNLSPRDSAWLFEWTDPPVPEGWHGVLNKDRGTVVHVRP